MSGNSMQPSQPERIEPSKLVEHFSELCRDIMVNTYNIKDSKFLKSVKRALKDIRNFKYGIMKRHDICFHADVSYKSPAVRCAYLFAYGVLNMIVIYFEFYQLFEKIQVCRKIFSKKKKLNICCLGGGSGIEAAAICKAVQDIFCKYDSEADCLTVVQVTVVDIVSEWKSEGESMTNSLNKSSSMFGSTKVNFQYSFVEADLLSEFEEVLKEKIAEADLITVVKLGSAIAERSTSSGFIEKLENTIKNVIDNMEKNSCLFMLDLAGGNTFNKLAHVKSDPKNKFSFTQSLHKKYCLLPKTLQQMEAYINFQKFADISTLFPTKLTTISSCIRVKRSPSQKQKLESSAKTKKNTKDNSKPAV